MGSHRDGVWPFRWDLLLRYRYLEIIALWEGRLTTRHLCDTFGIGRQQASKDINSYRREVSSGNLEYDKHLKGYVPSPTFSPRVTAGLADEYLQLAARNNELANVFESLSLGLGNIEVLQVPVRDVQATTLRPILQAARQQRRIDVDYVSVNNPDREGRIIVPHTLVYTGLRWHVRAWCEKNTGYRDFVLSRFRGEPEMMDNSAHGAAGDEAWQTRVQLRLRPDPRLTTAQQAVVATDYGMIDGELAIETRGSLVPYVLQRLQLDPDRESAAPIAQQLVIVDPAAVRRWLFRG
jgi:predicted DNA-binding transcriptional regulator YafY